LNLILYLESVIPSSWKMNKEYQSNIFCLIEMWQKWTYRDRNGNTVIKDAFKDARSK
jgi:hypothetical protein